MSTFRLNVSWLCGICNEPHQHPNSPRQLVHLPGLLGGVVVHRAPQQHDLGAAALEQRHLVLLAHVLEGVDLLGHLDQPPDHDGGQVDDVDERRVGLEGLLRVALQQRLR
jgi:hypothetical protein